MFETLTDKEKTLITERAAQFQLTLAVAGATDWEPFLAGLVGNARLLLLTDFIVRDLGYRWRKGERPKVEDYLARYPEIGPAEKVPPAIILEEHRCRVRAGEPANATEYRDRFPVQFPSIQTELEAVGVSWTIPETGVRRWEPMAEALVAVSQQYELVRELGRGMFGEVWLARKKPSGIEKAIKILLQAADRDSAQRELKSLELIKNLRHPYLLATEDFWIANNRLHIVMELAEGTLRARLKHYLSQGMPGIPADELFQYIAEAAEGLDFLHGHKITHRDVKPDNILILHGHAKLADFGLAREQELRVESMSLAGTPAYMAPEIWDGEGGPASDLYSLAFAYAELRQGRSPLKPRGLSELMKAHQEGSYEFTDTVTEAERTVLRRAMAQQPQQRYSTCIDFAADLAEALGRPFAGGGHKIAGRSAPPQNDPIAVFGSAGAFDSASLPVPLKSDATEVIEPEKPEPPPKPAWVRPSRARIFAEMLAIVAVMIAVMVGLWLAIVGPRIPLLHQPDEQQLVFPAGTTPEEGAKEVQLIGKKAPEWVFVEKGGERIRFRLITGQPGPSVPSFYIMETKVTNKLFKGGDDAPVVNITALQAREFAVREFNGDLPSADEWDHAAGLHDQQGQPGPTLPPGRAWIEKGTPGPVKRETNEADVNRFGLLDMAGNGREWTRTILTRSGARKILGADALGETDKVILRGRNFTLDRALSFAILEKERTTQPQAATASVASPYTGFRVVLPLP